METLHENRRSLGPFLFFAVVAVLVVVGDAADWIPSSLAVLLVTITVIAFARLVGIRYVDASVDSSGTHALDAGEDETPANDSMAGPPVPPAPFKRRLARFLHCSEDELFAAHERPKSTMAFWSARPLGRRYGPKPLWHIRLLLARIQRFVHGSPLTRTTDRVKRLE